MIPDKNCSTQKRPLANFEYIFQYDGFIDLRQRFMNTDEDGDSYDPDTDTKTSRYLSESTLEFYEEPETFTDHYSRLLNTEYKLSCENIDNHYYEHQDDVNVTRYFKSALSTLDYLLMEIENNNDLNRYEESKNSIIKLIEFIHNKYELFVPKEMIEKKVNVDAKDAKEDDQNNFTKSTIEDHLEQFKDDINSDGYNRLVDALSDYFTIGTFPVLDDAINFKRINKKRVGWALKELYKSLKTDNLDIVYLRFAKDNINLFAKEVIVTEGFNKSNFYKAFTTNPA